MKINMKRSTLSMSNIIYIMITILIILNSGSVFFGMIYAKQTRGVTCIVLFFSFIALRKKINIKCISRLFFIIVLLAIHMLSHFYELSGAYIYDISNVILQFALAALICMTIPLKVYEKYYINMITIIGCISLTCFTIRLINVDLMKNYINVYMSNTTGVIQYSFFYTWGWENIFMRNAGIFWEPGAYQAFVNLAILFLIKDNNSINNLFAKLKFYILAIVIFSTQSTTGYLVFALILMLFWKNFYRLIFGEKRKYEMLAKAFFILVMSLLVIAIINSEAVVNKFSNDNSSYVSYSIRNNDLSQSIEMVLEKPFFGYGLEDNLRIREQFSGIKNNSNGLLYYAYMLGLVFYIPAIFFYKKGLDTCFYQKKILKKIGIYIVFFIFWSTEGFLYSPVFLIYVFGDIQVKINERKNESIICHSNLKSNNYIYRLEKNMSNGGIVI